MFTRSDETKEKVFAFLRWGIARFAYGDGGRLSADE